MKILIIEDEQIAGLYLKDVLLKISPDLEIELTLTLMDGVKAVKKLSPDLIFLDIELGKDNGFDLFEIYEHTQLNVIFVTSYQEFAINAFRINAIDYILKPINEKIVKEAFLKFLATGKKTQSVSISQPPSDKILVWEDAKYKPVNAKDIVKIKADKQYSKMFFTNAKPNLMSKSLNEFESKLDPVSFIRIHDSCIVNIHHIVSYLPGVIARVEMSDNSFEVISRRKKSAFLKAFRK